MTYDVVIVNWNAGPVLRACLASLERAKPRPATVWVVDNGSSDGSDLLVERECPWVELRRPGANLGFAGGNNVALREIASREQRPDAILLLNPDAELRDGAIARLLQTLEAEPEVGLVGGQLLYPDGSFQSSAAPFPNLGRELLILTGLGRRRYGPWYPAHGPQPRPEPRDVDYVVGAAMLARTRAVEQVGLLDENFFIYSEEVDWCYRFWRAGWRVRQEPRAEILHHIGASTSQVRPQMLAELYRNRVRFFRKHYGRAAALGLKGLLWATLIAKHAARLRPGASGAPPLPMPMLRAALRDV